MSFVRSAIAAIVYAALMTAWAWHDRDPFRDSYLLGFLFYGLTFGIVFHVLMNWVARKDSSKTG
ncbi:hypothetical protein [Qipengyuania sp. MTN3-11]|uniref:hypothetical protein n=1 Tax=Qipengyuania sp. MTN3-11 TaxID=3056557 RepID=UPI0036F1BB5A